MKLCNGLTKTCFTCVELRTKLRDWDSFLVPRLPTLEGCGEFLSPVLVDTLPSRCERQAVKGSGIRGNPNFHSFVIAAIIFGFDSGSVLVNFRQVPIRSEEHTAELQ